MSGMIYQEDRPSGTVPVCGLLWQQPPELHCWEVLLHSTHDVLLMCRKTTLRSRCLRQRTFLQRSLPRLMVEMRTEQRAPLYNIVVQKQTSQEE